MGLTYVLTLFIVNGVPFNEAHDNDTMRSDYVLELETPV